jgi:hypothetical protein
MEQDEVERGELPRALGIIVDIELGERCSAGKGDAQEYPRGQVTQYADYEDWNALDYSDKY